MTIKIKLFFLSFFLGASFFAFSQQENIKLNADKVQKYERYLEARMGYVPNGFENWKNTNKLLYTKEMWYYTESFYVKREHLNQGGVLDESIIDVSRFEASRKQTEEAIVTLPGFKDAIVLLPASKLIYKP